MRLFMAFEPFWGVLEVLSILMLIDCAINRRDLYWFFVVFFLGPFGGIVYLCYHWHSVTFPLAPARLSAGGPQRRGGKVCTRCFQQVNRLEPYQDGRAMHYLCAMCRSEMDILRADRLKVD
ncbi:MAG: hypothetical protein ACYCW6_29035 [Candidatus Xenobia bacterium]